VKDFVFLGIASFFPSIQLYYRFPDNPTASHTASHTNCTYGHTVTPTVSLPLCRGMKTLYGESFQDISPEKRRELFASSVKSPPLETMTMGVTAKEMLDATPNMYKTSYTAQTEQATMLT
jgi:hypothetical protein